MRKILYLVPISKSGITNENDLNIKLHASNLKKTVFGDVGNVSSCHNLALEFF